MSKDYSQCIIEIYDSILSSLPHVRSLNIDISNFQKVINIVSLDHRYSDEELNQAHNQVIGEVIFSLNGSQLVDTKKYIEYPDFSVKTYIPNPTFFFKDSESIEKSVLIAKNSELNIILKTKEYRLPDTLKFLRILSIQRLELAPHLAYYNLSTKVIPSTTFYEFYNAGAQAYKKTPVLPENDVIRLQSRAIHDSLNVLGIDVPTNPEGEFIVYDKDYQKLKDYLKKHFGVTYDDEYTSINGNKETVWTKLGYLKFDNRLITNFQSKPRIIPLSLQKIINKK